MPNVKRRKKGPAPSAQVRKPSASPGKPDNFDGRANPRADTPTPKKSDYEGPGKKI